MKLELLKISSRGSAPHPTGAARPGPRNPSLDAPPRHPRPPVTPPGLGNKQAARRRDGQSRSLGIPHWVACSKSRGRLRITSVSPRVCGQCFESYCASTSSAACAPPHHSCRRGGRRSRGPQSPLRTPSSRPPRCSRPCYPGPTRPAHLCQSLAVRNAAHCHL